MLIRAASCRRNDEGKLELAKMTAVDGILRLERLVDSNLSLDQGDLVREDPRVVLTFASPYISCDGGKQPHGDP